MRVAVVTNDSRPEAVSFAGTLVEAVRQRKIELVAPSEAEAPELVLAVGGDGTMLRAVRLALGLDVPVLGFNLGNLGFLAEAEPSDLESVLAAVTEGRLEVTKRMTVEATLPDGSQRVGVNDVVVEKIDSQRLVALAVDIDGNHYHTYRADGLIVSTPTGSSAYSFSAGGPLVDPALEALILSPVAAHSLFGRSLVLAPTSDITMTVAADRPVRVSVDGWEAGTNSQGQVVRVRRGPRPARFVVLDHRAFPVTVRTKFRLEP